MNRAILILLVCMQFMDLSAQTNSIIYQKLQRTRLPGSNSIVLTGTCPVFENRETGNGRIINLNIVVIPAVHAAAARTPIFYFDGGPGVAATNNAAFYADSLNGYCLYHDIILVDIRGTGKSNPLNCPSLQIKHSLEEQFDDMYPPGAVKECYAELSKIGDLTQYTTTNVVKDLEEVRQWLGYGRINIYGLSYGTRVALVYIKMFPSAVESCILWSPIGTDARMPLYHARFAQNSLEAIFAGCSNDAACKLNFPNLANEFKTLMQKGKLKNFSYQGPSGNSVVSFSWNAFQTKLRALMYTPDGIRKVPYLIHQAALGNWEPFIALYPKGNDTTNFIAEGLYLCITCAEDVPFIHEKEKVPVTKGTFMGTYRIDQQKAACKEWIQGKIPNDFFDATVADIPTLVFSGGLDPITPTSLARVIASHLPKSLLIVIPQMSHTLDGLSHPECFDHICLDFINDPNTQRINADCIKEMKPGKFIVKEQ